MIIDHIENIGLYKGISPGLSEGLDFIAALRSDIAVGTHQVSGRVKVIVSEYLTRPAQDCRYETHEKAVDIQYLIKGREVIRWQPAASLSAASEYDSQKDIRFYSAGNEGTDLLIGEGVFVIFFPDDGHCPGLAADSGPESVKKAVAKVSVEESGL